MRGNLKNCLAILTCQENRHFLYILVGMTSKIKTIMARTDSNVIIWNTKNPTPKQDISHGDIRIVNLPVQAVFVWSDKIIADFDSETGEVLEYTSGFVMEVLACQKFLYKGEDTTFLHQTILEKLK